MGRFSVQPLIINSIYFTAQFLVVINMIGLFTLIKWALNFYPSWKISTHIFLWYAALKSVLFS